MTLWLDIRDMPKVGKDRGLYKSLKHLTCSQKYLSYKFT